MINIKHTESERSGIFEAWLNDVQVGELTYQMTTCHKLPCIIGIFWHFFDIDRNLIIF